MLLALIRRLGQMLFVMFGISVLVFLIFFATPGSDPRRASPAAMPRPKRCRPCAKTSVSIDPCRFNT